MKLRIYGDSLRLRISPSEMARLLQSGRIEETIHFGPEPDSRLTYALVAVRDQNSPFAVRRSPEEIVVLVPAAQASTWAESEEVGIYGTVEAGTGRLQLAVEKDFACLDKSDHEDQDTYPHPNQGIAC